jgi:hypothetical protein
MRVLLGRLAICPVLLLAITLHGQQAKKTVPSPAASSDPFESFQTFSAVLNGGLGKDHDRHIYRSGHWMRIEFDDAPRISNILTKETWVTAQDHRCFKFGVPDSGTYPFGVFRGYKIDRSPTTQKETVDGHTCSIENVTFTGQNGNETVVRMKLWKADDLQNFPIKIAVDSNGRHFEANYSKVDLKAPDPKLFQHPVKCEAGPQQAVGGTTAAPPKTPKKP